MLKITKLIGLGETLAALARRRGGGGLRRGIAGIGDSRGRSFAKQQKVDLFLTSSILRLLLLFVLIYFKKEEGHF